MINENTRGCQLESINSFQRQISMKKSTFLSHGLHQTAKIRKCIIFRCYCFVLEEDFIDRFIYEIKRGLCIDVFYHRDSWLRAELRSCVLFWVIFFWEEECLMLLVNPPGTNRQGFYYVPSFKKLLHFDDEKCQKVQSLFIAIWIDFFYAI